MYERNLQNAIELVKNMQYQEAVEALKTIIDGGLEDLTHFQALKLYGDILGPIAYKDYMGAVDIYQAVINGTEDDDLYNQCQMSILNAYLSISMDTMEAFEGLRDMIETEDEQIHDFLGTLDRKREEFITSRAEAIYKQRL